MQLRYALLACPTRVSRDVCKRRDVVASRSGHRASRFAFMQAARVAYGLRDYFESREGLFLTRATSDRRDHFESRS